MEKKNYQQPNLNVIDMRAFDELCDLIPTSNGSGEADSKRLQNTKWEEDEE